MDFDCGEVRRSYFHATVAILFVSVSFGHIYMGTLGVEGDCRRYPEDIPVTVEHMLEPTGTVEKTSPWWKRSVLPVVVIGLQQRKEKRSSLQGISPW